MNIKTMTREDNKMKPLMVARKTYAFPNNVLNIETVNDSKFTKRRNKHNTHNFIYIPHRQKNVASEDKIISFK